MPRSRIVHPSHARRSSRRSGVRERVLLWVDRKGAAYPKELAHAANTDYRNVMGALFGRPPRYGEKLALVALGLVVETPSESGRLFAITDAGRAEAARLREERRRLGSP